MHNPSIPLSADWISLTSWWSGYMFCTDVEAPYFCTAVLDKWEYEVSATTGFGHADVMHMGSSCDMMCFFMLGQFDHFTLMTVISILGVFSTFVVYGCHQCIFTGLTVVAQSNTTFLCYESIFFSNIIPAPHVLSHCKASWMDRMNTNYLLIWSLSGN